MDQELKKLQVSGFYRDVELPPPTNILDDVEKKIAEKMGFRATSDDRYKLLEMQVDLVIEDDKFAKEDAKAGIAVPYIVTIDKNSQTVLAVRRNWDPKTTPNKSAIISFIILRAAFGFYAFA